MEPHGVVEARTLEVLLHERNAVRQRRGVEQGQVRRVGQHTLVQTRIVGQIPDRAKPDVLEGLALDRIELVDRVDRARFDRAFPKEDVPPTLGDPIDDSLAKLDLVREPLGTGHVGHLDLVVESLLGDLETHRHVEDRASVLDRDDASRGEALAVADAIDFVEDRDLHVARAQEVAVQGMGAAILDGSRSCNERLSEDLAAEDALPALVGAIAAEQV